MPRKYTRKQLKKPDEFISASMKAWSYLSGQLPAVLAAAAVVAAVVGGIWAWTYFADRRGMTTTEMLTRAVEIEHQMVLPSGMTLPPAEDGLPRFTSRPAKLKAAEEELDKVVKRGGRLGPLAHAFRAGVRFDAGRYREAIEDYQKVLADTDDPAIKARAIEGLGYSYEGLRDWDKALESFRKLPREGDAKFLAIYHEARILAKRGQGKEAAKLLQEVLSGAGPNLQDRASDQLAMLETK